MIELNGIWKKYNKKSVFSDFSINIKENEFVTIIGPSGAGKTTLLNLIGLLDYPDRGTVKVSGYINPKRKEIEYLRRFKLGYIFQNYVLMDNETVYRNLLISKAYNKDFNKEKVVETLHAVGLSTSCLNQKIYQLSGGEQQRIAIARV